MKRRMVATVLVLVLILAAMPVTAFAAGSEHRLAAGNIRLSNDQYYKTGEVKSSLKEITAVFDWGYESNDVDSARLVLMTKRLSGSDHPGDSVYDSDCDFSEMGNYADKHFANYNDAVDYDNQYNTLGIISANGSGFSIGKNSQNNSATFKFAENTISMNGQATYYIYLWVTYKGDFYPDNLICVINVDNGRLTFAPGDASGGLRNYYNENTFREVGSYLVEVVPGTGMNLSSGSAKQSVASGSSMTEVVYTAANNYMFPEGYAVASSNGVHVTRISDNQIKVSGTPTKDVKITLKNATYDDNAVNHNHTIKYEYDNNEHWGVTQCTINTCSEKGKIIDNTRGAHVFSSAQDTDCDCGYERKLSGGAEDPAAKPNTGDITHIPLWTGMIFLGAAAMYIQLAQRKREEF